MRVLKRKSGSNLSCSCKRNSSWNRWTRSLKGVKRLCRSRLNRLCSRILPSRAVLTQQHQRNPSLFRMGFLLHCNWNHLWISTRRIIRLVNWKHSDTRFFRMKTRIPPQQFKISSRRPLPQARVRLLQTGWYSPVHRWNQSFKAQDSKEPIAAIVTTHHPKHNWINHQRIKLSKKIPKKSNS